MVNKELIELALSEYGIQEWAGDAHNPEVLKYSNAIGHEWVDNDELPWCSSYVNWIAKEAGYEYSTKLNARSWLGIGDVILYKSDSGKLIWNEELSNTALNTNRRPRPSLGDVLIFWRIKEDSPYGHVGFYINEDKYYYYVLGGNQDNQVKISKYPKSRLLGIRRLRKASEIVS